MAKILIAEDNKDFTLLLEMLLKSNGYETHITYNGKQAVEELEKNPSYDLVISDIIMPEMDGFDLIDYICENTSIKVIALSGGGITLSADKALMAIEEKVFASLQKPIDMDTLLLTVRNALAS